MAQERPDNTQPRAEISFACRSCGHKFKSPPGRTEEAQEQDWHPWNYYAECPECGAEAPQAAWERGLFKAWTQATGPKTPEGKAASAANLEGHPTPEEALITRMNAVKHMGAAKTLKYFPARPGHYPQCDSCEHLADKDCLEYKACIKRAEVMLRHQAAFERKDPNLLMDLFAEKHAALASLIDWMIMEVAKLGVTLKSPEWYYDKEGTFHLAQWCDEHTGELQQIYKYEANPLLKTLIDYVQKLAMNLSDLEMTPKVQNEQEIMQGYIDQKNQEAEEEQAYRQKLEQGQRQLLELINDSHESHPSPARPSRTIDGEGNYIDG